MRLPPGLCVQPGPALMPPVVRCPPAQVQFSLLSIGSDQAAVKATADDLGVTLISYSPLALGLLTGRQHRHGWLLPGCTAGCWHRDILLAQ